MTVVAPATEPPEAPEVVEQLEHVWADRPGVIGFLTTVDHKRIGIRYIVTAFVFFFLAGSEALGMRSQLAHPNETLLSAGAYNDLFTLHGTTMIFLFNTPVLAGFGNYLLPLQIGSRDMAFPRLNAFGYWVFVMSGVFLYSSVLVGSPPDAGWFAYAPLTSSTYSRGIGLDFWALAVIFVGISSTTGAVNFVVTTFKLRAPGMSVSRLPLLVWSLLTMSFMILFAFPVLTLATVLLEADRRAGFRFYDPVHGGSPLLYQHLFWFWGHPEVYILLLPAIGMMSMIIPVFSRRRLSGYIWVVSALVAIAFISFGVWVHHMFATGLPVLALSLFSAVSLIIAIPSGVQFFAWIATMWGSPVRWRTPMLFSAGFMVIFLIGGLSGVMVASLPFDNQVTDSYFIVAHFHYVLNGAVVFPVFAAVYFWFPKMTGRMMSERLGRWNFWIMVVAFNITFFPMHLLGMWGMPRRVYTYQAGLGWDTANLIATIGGFLFGFGTLLTVVNVWWSRRHGEIAPPNPWAADGLEWAVASPAPEWNFTEIPEVVGRHPLWDGELVPASVIADPPPGLDPELRASFGVDGALARQTPLTSGLATAPEAIFRIPRPTYVPFVAALGVAGLFVGLLVYAPVVIVTGLAVGLVAIARWTWRTEADLT